MNFVEIVLGATLHATSLTCMDSRCLLDMGIRSELTQVSNLHCVAAIRSVFSSGDRRGSLTFPAKCSILTPMKPGFSNETSCMNDSPPRANPSCAVVLRKRSPS